MKNYIVKYTTGKNNDEEFYTTVTALDYTKAYFAFIFSFPIGYIIIKITEGSLA